MTTERGHVAVYLLFSFALAGAAGYGVYTLIKNHAKAEASETHATTTTAPTPAPIVEPPPPPSGDMIASKEDLFDAAERDARDPDVPAERVGNAVVYGAAGVDGTLAAQTVEAVIKRYSGRWNRCLEKAIERRPSAGGVLRMRFTITADGKVGELQITSVGLDDAMGICVAATASKLRFPKPNGGRPTRVVFPLGFWPGSPERDPLGDLQ
jgi:hypothetical protein